MIIQELALQYAMEDIEYCPFLQCWNIPAPGINNIKRMLGVARKYKTNLMAIRIMPHLNAQLLAWYHIAAEHRSMLGAATKCLIKKHKAMTVADFLRISNRVRNRTNEQHIPSPYCHCQDCERDKQANCLNPHAYATEVSIRLQLITPRLHPLMAPLINDNLSLTATRKVRNKVARTSNQEILFNLTITSRTDLAECFRIFTNPERILGLPATHHLIHLQNIRLPTITVYMDRACYNNGKENTQSRSGA